MDIFTVRSVYINLLAALSVKEGVYRAKKAEKHLSRFFTFFNVGTPEEVLFFVLFNQPITNDEILN